jgi:3-oxoacyl-[acyl-carrier protein] reductase
MDLGISGRVALVAGASRGLGHAAASALVAEGCRVAIVARDGARLEAAAAGLGAVAVAGDVSRADEITRIVAEVRERLGAIDILVANAGGPPPGRFVDATPDDWDVAVQQTLMGTIRLMNAVLPGMRERRWGRIVTITSRTAREAIDGLALSNATRAGVAGAVRTLAREVAADGVLVTNVMPGAFDTERLREIHGGDAAVAARGAATPMGRIGRPEELGAVVAFLASECASYVSGASILVDGAEGHVIA